MIDQLAIRYCSFFKLSVPFSEGELKSAYRIAVKKYHPDLNPNIPNANEILQEVNKAHDYLKANAVRINASPSASASPWSSPRPNWQSSNPAPTVDPRDQFKQDAPRERGFKPTGIVLYRGPFEEVPTEISIPEEAFEPGCTIFMMVKGKEVRMNVPSNAKENFAATLIMRGDEYTIRLVPQPLKSNQNPYTKRKIY